MIPIEESLREAWCKFRDYVNDEMQHAPENAQRKLNGAGAFVVFLCECKPEKEKKLHMQSTSEVDGPRIRESLIVDTLSLLHGLRFIDSFFPSGGYAYSSGLEAAVQGNQIHNAEDLSYYVEDLFRRGLGHCEAVAAGLGHDAAISGTLQVALGADQELDAMKLSRDARMASRQMGRQILRSAGEQAVPSSTLRHFAAEVEGDRSPGHLAVSLGLTLGTLKWPRQESVAAFLYHTAVGFVSASLKLLPIGQREGQRLLARWMPLIVEVSCQVEHEETLTSWSPVQDIYSMRHARLTSRLFRS